MEGCQAVGAHRGAVLARRVAAVALPAVLGVPAREVDHQPVANGLRDHRRARDRVADRVTVHDGGVRPDVNRSFLPAMIRLSGYRLWIMGFAILWYGYFSVRVIIEYGAQLF